MRLFNSRLMGCSWLGVLALCACGGVSRVDSPALPDDRAGSSAGGAAGAGRGGEETAGAPAGGSHAAGSSNAGGSSAAGASACSRFLDQPPQRVTVTLRNDTAAPIYLGARQQTCGTTPFYDVHDASGRPIVARDRCGSPCEGWLTGNPIGGCPGICQSPSITKLSPTETIVTEWSGLSALDVQLPPQCNASQLGGDIQCSVDQRIEPGAYTFSATAGSDFVCQDSPNGCDQCTPAASGGCVVNGAMAGGSRIVALSDVVLDDSYGIGKSGGSQNPGKNRQVELVFRPLP